MSRTRWDLSTEADASLSIASTSPGTAVNGTAFDFSSTSFKPNRKFLAVCSVQTISTAATASLGVTFTVQAATGTGGTFSSTRVEAVSSTGVLQTSTNGEVDLIAFRLNATNPAARIVATPGSTAIDFVATASILTLPSL